jgi:BirA family transcriptional regulator, biotin operon repressor / biotin---[acetyl-CoA-carboxylase] ligase
MASGGHTARALGRPRLHLRTTTSTNDRARALAQAGAPDGTLVTASAQTAGRGRQGRSWSAPAGRALLLSLVLRDPPALLPLAAALAVAEVAGDDARIKWPNDVLVHERKVAGILAEARPDAGWAILGIGLNVAVRMDDFPAELQATAGTLGLEPQDIEPTLIRLLEALERSLALDTPGLLEAYRVRDALRGHDVRWANGAGTAAGIDEAGRLVVELPGGGHEALSAGEVHLERG